MTRDSKLMSSGWLVRSALVGCALAGALLVVQTRWRLAASFDASKRDPDIYALPAPAYNVLISLGYRAALADLLYASARVAYGIHVSERRRFEAAGDYLDTITTLDPKFREPYLFTDTFLTLQAARARVEDHRRARQLLERGMQELPLDTQLWFTAGQYLAYLAVHHVPEAEQAEWRLAGAQALSRACELAGQNKNIPYHCIAAAGLLSRAGEREALIQMLTRTIAVTDDEEIRERALSYLEQQIGEQQREASAARFEAFQQAWRADLPFVSPDMMLLLGPKIDSARCAGAQREDEVCKTTWIAWAEVAPRVLGLD